MKKVLTIVIMLLIILLSFYNQAYADYTDPIENPGTYTPSSNLESDNTKFIERGGQAIAVLRIVGTFVSVITLMALGIRYMLGSVSDKALYKETMGPYLIGAIMVFTIPNLIGIIFDFVTANIK